MEKHWSMPEPKPKPSLFFTVSCTEFGKVKAACECGWQTLTVTSAETNARGRPGKPITAMQMAHQQMTDHAKLRHPNREPYVSLQAASGAHTVPMKIIRERRKATR